MTVNKINVIRFCPVFNLIFLTWQPCPHALSGLQKNADHRQTSMLKFSEILLQ